MSIGDRMSATATIGKVNLQKVASFRWLGFKQGPLPEILNTNKIRTLKSINPVNFKFLHRKTKSSKFCNFKGLGDQIEASKLDFFYLNILRASKSIHPENLKVLPQKLNKSKILTIFKNFEKNLAAPNKKSGTSVFWLWVGRQSLKIWRS